MKKAVNKASRKRTLKEKIKNKLNKPYKTQSKNSKNTFLFTKTPK